MIKDNFYPTTERPQWGEYTNNITSFNIANGDFPDAYYLGYISSDNLPKICNVTLIQNDGETIKFTPLLKSDNYNCGYVYATSYYFAVWSDPFTSNARFINKLEVQTTEYKNNTAYLALSYCDSEKKTYTTPGTDSIELTPDGLYNFLYNDSAITYHDMSIKASDFDGCRAIKDGKEIYIFNIAITGSNAPISFFAVGELDNSSNPLLLPKTQVFLNLISQTQSTFNFDYSSISDSLISGYLTGEINVSELSSIDYEQYWFDGQRGFYTYNAYSHSVYVYPLIDIDDLKKMFGLYIRWDADGQNKYMPYITPNNEFTATVVKGDPTSPEFQEQLRHWQYEVNAWAEETYTPDDKPEYVPGGGDDTPVTPDDFGDIPLGWFPAQNSIGGFVKYYMLNSLAVASLGKSLWDGLAGYTPPAGDVMTKNMIDNFYLNYSPSLENFDLSLTLSNVIDYFTGIRYFPIPNLPQSTGNSVVPVTSVNVGTGSTPIDIVGSGLIGGQGFLISNRLVTLSGGSVSGSEIRQNLYNNFLDYEPNVSCSVYIPYCGSVSLQPSTVLDPSMTSLEIRYGLDLYTGGICAVLMKNGKASFPLAISEGVIGFDLPLTGNNFNTQAISTMLSTARFENNLTASLIGTTSQAIGQAFTDPLGSIGTSLGAGISTANKEMNLALSYPQMMGTSPIAVGRTSSMAGMIQPTRAFIQFVKHSAEIPDNYGNIFGFNSNTYDTIGNQQGFFVCVNPRLDGIPCTQAERDEIYKLLTTGVYIS